MPAATVVLTVQNVNYNLYSLITALAGYSQTKPTCREMTITSDSGNGAANIRRVDSGGDDTHYGYLLTPGQSQTYRSNVNDVPLGIWFRSDTAGASLNCEWNYQ